MQIEFARVCFAVLTLLELLAVIVSIAASLRGLLLLSDSVVVATCSVCTVVFFSQLSKRRVVFERYERLFLLSAVCLLVLSTWAIATIRIFPLISREEFLLVNVTVKTVIFVATWFSTTKALSSSISPDSKHWCNSVSHKFYLNTGQVSNSRLRQLMQEQSHDDLQLAAATLEIDVSPVANKKMTIKAMLNWATTIERKMSLLEQVTESEEKTANF